jgi:FtsP/CotA-like multicopper oxidase with cupredoxin domain
MMNGMMMGVGQKIEWEDMMGEMNTDSTTENVTWKLVDEMTGKENMDIDWQFKQGDVVKIRIFNDPGSMHPMQHPIHLHGQRFLVLSTNGIANTNLVWKDTTLIQTGDTVDLLVDMSNPGTWMLHCHIAEHLEADMMLGFEVL